MPSRSPIPTPPTVRWQRLRYRLLPVLVVLLCSILAWRLWQAQAPMAASVGIVDPSRAQVRSPRAGVVLKPGSSALKVFDTVFSGDVVARIRPTARAPTTAPSAPSSASTAHPAPAAAASAASRPGAVGDDAGGDGTGGDGADAANSTVGADGADQLNDADEDADGLIPVLAPISGQIITIIRRPGDLVAPGDPILVIASSSGQTVTTYVKSTASAQPERDMLADLRFRSDPHHVYVGKVDRVGPEILEMPDHLLRDQKTKDWGLPTRIALPLDLPPVRPGELVDVTLRPRAEHEGAIGR